MDRRSLPPIFGADLSLPAGVIFGMDLAATDDGCVVAIGRPSPPQGFVIVKVTGRKGSAT